MSTQTNDSHHRVAATAAADTVAVSSSRTFQAFLAAMLGVVIVFGVGFAPSEVVHNAAHDGRHSLAVPCH